MRPPARNSIKTVVSAAIPVAKAKPAVPPSKAAKQVSSARLVGLPLRE
jgi:hypothetical protein